MAQRGEIERFRRGDQLYGVRLDREDRRDLVAGHFEIGVDFVRDDRHVVPAGEGADVFQLHARPHAADGIVRVAEQQGLRARLKGRLEIVIVDAPAALILNERTAADMAPRRLRAGIERAVDRREDDRRIARLRDRGDGDAQAVHNARREQHVALFDLQIVAALHPAGHGLVIRAGDGGVAERAVGDAACHGVDHRLRRGEIHIGHPHGQHVLRAEYFFALVPLFAVCARAVHALVKRKHGYIPLCMRSFHETIIDRPCEKSNPAAFIWRKQSALFCDDRLG